MTIPKHGIRWMAKQLVHDLLIMFCLLGVLYMVGSQIGGFSLGGLHFIFR